MNMNHDKQLIIKTALIVSAFFLFIIVLWHMLTHHKTKPVLVPKVVVEKPQLINMTDYVMQTGTLVAFNSVNLVARVEGYLEAIEFTDGTFVDKGKELFVIEPEPYAEKLKASEASILVQKASFEYSTSEYKRQQQMYKQNATSLNNVEKWSAKAQEFKAEVAKVTADAAVSAINYSYTHVHAPFRGRIGRHLVDVGNLVGNGKATNLATIDQIDPIYVYFNLNELDLIKIRDAANAHGFKPSDIDTIPVQVRMQNESKFLHQGHLNFVNTGLNASTGTMEFRALLPNKNLMMLPGLFVQVRVPLSKPLPQLTVPETSIQSDQIGPYLLALDQKNIVVQKRVQIGALDSGRRAIVKGLTAVDRVVVIGLQNAIPGHEVQPINSENKPA